MVKERVSHVELRKAPTRRLRRTRIIDHPDAIPRRDVVATPEHVFDGSVKVDVHHICLRDGWIEANTAEARKGAGEGERPVITAVKDGQSLIQPHGRRRHHGGLMNQNAPKSPLPQPRLGDEVRLPGQDCAGDAAQSLVG